MRGVRSLHRRQRGISLVELMVALALGFFLVAGVITVLVANRTSYIVETNAARLQEDGRFALTVLARDIRMADFWGCTPPTNLSNDLDPAGTGFANYDFLAGGGLGGVEGGADPDAITVVGASGTSLYVVAPFGPQPSANIKVTAPNDLAVGDVVLVADCSSGDIFQLSGGNPAVNGVLVHNTGAATEPGNYNSGSCTGGNAHCLSKVYGADAQVLRMAMTRYAVATGSDGDPALFRTVNGTAQEMVPDIADFQVFYGEDTDGDGSANRYRDADQVDMADVVAVRLSLTLQGEPNSNGAGGRLQRTLNATVAVRNRVP